MRAILNVNNLDTGKVLIRIYEELLGYYGPRGWWPSRSGSPWEIMMGAVLVQRTSWANVEKSLDNIEAGWGQRGLADSQRVLAAGDAELAELIRPSGHYNSKPRKLKNLAGFVASAGGLDSLVNTRAETARLRAELLSLWGIGPETADAILLYALGRPIFVADAYALRLASRWGLLSPDAKYGDIQSLFMDNLPHDAALFGEYHALTVEHGRQTCRPRPRCEVCPLNHPIVFDVQQESAAEWRCPRNNVAWEART